MYFYLNMLSLSSLSGSSLAYISTYLRKLLSWSTWVIRLICKFCMNVAFKIFQTCFKRVSNVFQSIDCFVPAWRSKSFRVGLGEHNVRREHHQVTCEKAPQALALRRSVRAMRGEISPVALQWPYLPACWIFKLQRTLPRLSLVSRLDGP